MLNALEAVKAATLGQLEEPSRREALSLLDATNARAGFPAEVRKLLENAPALPPRQPSLFTRWAEALRASYVGVTERRWFVATIDAFFTFLALAAVLTVISLVLDGPGVVGFDEWASLISSMIANGCLIVGVVLLRRHQKLRAYQWFDRGLLISIFITQVFVFADEQLGGTIGLIIILIVWVLLRGAMRAERDRQAVDAADEHTG
jgi:cytochrome c oxidase subunit IV